MIDSANKKGESMRVITCKDIDQEKRQEFIDTVALLILAFEKHGTTDLTPCGRNTQFRDCVTSFRGKKMLWYNTSDHSTCLVSITMLN